MSLLRLFMPLHTILAHFWPLARWLDRELNLPVPLFKTTRRNIAATLKGTHVPRVELAGCCLTEPSLEDFALARAESRKAQEEDELLDVIAYLKIAKLASVARANEPQIMHYK